MEHLLFLLFVLFSVGSALLERRKRKAARRREEEAARRGEEVAEVADEEEEDQPWSFPSADPFELEPMPERISTPELERQALEAAQRTQEAEERARQLERQAQEVVPRRRIEELVRQAQPQQQTRPAPHRSKGGSISAAEARRGIVYAEILGKPKALRQDSI